jgi:AcrR family transcriptional regulator
VPAAPALDRSPGPRQRRGGERTAERILDAAEALFAERGYEGASQRDVAERAGLSAASLYNHFPSKDALYAAVLERGLAPVLAALSGPERGAEPPAERSRRIVADVMALLARHPNLPRLVLHETLSGGQRLTPMLRGWIAPALTRARELVEANPAAARWRPDLIPHLVVALYHVVLGHFTFAPLYRDLSGVDLLSEEAVARQTRFLGELVEALFPDPPADPGRRAGDWR